MRRASATGERLFFLFLLGVFLFNPPLLSIFNLPEYLFGVPLLYLYLFAGWGILLVLAALTVEAGDDADEVQAGSEFPPGRGESA